MIGVVGFYHKFRDLINTLTDDEKNQCFKDADYLCDLSGWSNNKQGVIMGFQMCYAAFKNMHAWHKVDDNDLPKKSQTFICSINNTIVELKWCGSNWFNPITKENINYDKVDFWMEIPARPEVTYNNRLTVI